MRRIHQRSLFLALAALSAGISGCSASTGNMSTEGASSHEGTRFNNILVIGVANNYEGRSRFERKLTSELRAAGADATALYIAAGGNKPIVREAIEELVKTNGYDAVLISRPLNRDSDASMKSGSAATKAVRKDGGGIDLFRYDYEELNEPKTWIVDFSITISTELFAASGSQKVWSHETNVSKKETLEDLINEASEKIVRRLKRDRLIGN